MGNKKDIWRKKEENVKVCNMKSDEENNEEIWRKYEVNMKNYNELWKIYEEIEDSSIKCSLVYPKHPHFLRFSPLNIKTTSAIHELHISTSSEHIPKDKLILYAHVHSFQRGVYVEDIH